MLAKTLPDKYFIIVQGHTDSRPVKGGIYPSNWELSSARAGGVVRYLESQGFPSKRMRAVGMADTAQIEDTSDSAQNRRVVIQIDSEANWRAH
jgi:chemotaxis protein MotB